MFVLLMQFLWQYVEDLIGKGLSYSVILEIIITAASSLVPMALPISVLLASIMIFGNLAEHKELMAMKAAGISLIRIMQPLFIISVIITIAAFYFSNSILPVSNLKMRSLLYDISNKPPEIVIPIGIFYNELPGYSIKVGANDTETKTLRDLIIYNHTANKGNISMTIAKKGKIYHVNEHQYMVLRLFDGAAYEEGDENTKNRNYPQRRYTFKEQEIVFDLTGFGLQRSDENLFKSHYQMMSISNLKHSIDTLEMRADEQSKYFSENIARSHTLRRLYNPENNTAFVMPAGKLSTDSLYNTFDNPNKHQIINTAINFARNTRSYIESEDNAMNSRLKWIIKHKVELHRKFTLSLACLLFFFIGAPLGAIIKKGGIGLPVVASVVIFVLYYVVGMLGVKMAEQRQITIWGGMWLSTFILIPIAVLFNSRAIKDKEMINIGYYFSLFLLLFNKKAKKKEVNQ